MRAHTFMRPRHRVLSGYIDYKGLRELLTKHAPSTSRILQVGVGTSRLQEDLVRFGGYHVSRVATIM